MDNIKTITTNKKAFHEYFVLESFECGIELSGTEIKSIRQGGANLKDAWCSVENGEMIIKQMHSRKAGGTGACAAFALFQGFARKGTARAVQGQKAA